MPAETRYMRNDTEVVDSVTYYKLGTAQTGAHLERTKVGTGGSQPVVWGIRVWKYGGAEITAGTPVATVSRTGTGSGMQSATWACPGASGVNRIEVRVYTRFGTDPWQETEKFITEDLGGVTLDAVTWTVYYWTRWYYSAAEDVTYGYYRFGDSVENSRVENFSWTAVVPPAVDGLINLVMEEEF